MFILVFMFLSVVCVNGLMYQGSTPSSVEKIVCTSLGIHVYILYQAYNMYVLPVLHVLQI